MSEQTPEVGTKAALELAMACIIGTIMIDLMIPKPVGHECPTCGHYHYPDDDDED